MCPNINNSEVVDSFNDIVVSLGGSPLSIEEFKSSELRSLRIGEDYVAMELAYRIWDSTQGVFNHDDIHALALDAAGLSPISYNSNTDSKYNLFEDRLSANGFAHKTTDGIVVDKRTYNGINTDVRDAIFDLASDYGIKVSFTKFGDTYKVNYIGKNESKQLRRSYSKQRLIIEFLLDRFPLLKGRIHFLTEEDLQNPYFRMFRNESNAFWHNGNLYIKPNVNDNTVLIEELIHPLVYTLYQTERNTFDSIMLELKEQFPELYTQIQSVYSSKKTVYANGTSSNVKFNKTDRDNEFVAQALSRILSDKFAKNQKYNNILELFWSKCKEAIIKFFKNENIGNLFKNLMPNRLQDIDADLLCNMIYCDSVLFALTEDSLNQTFYSLSPLSSQYNLDQMDQIRSDFERVKNDFESTTARQLSQDAVDTTLSSIRAEILSKAKALSRTIKDSKSDSDLKQSLQFYISDLSNNSISDLESILSFIKSSRNDIGNIADEIQRAFASDYNSFSNERLMWIRKNFCGMYEPIIKELISRYEQISLLIDDKKKKDQIEKILRVSLKLFDNISFKLENLVTIRFKNIVAETFAEDSLSFISELTKYLTDDVNKVDGDINTITTYFLSPDKAKDPALKALYRLITESNHRKNARVLQRFTKLLELLKNVKKRDLIKLYERDENGKFTGYLTRDKKHGKFNNDYHNFLNQLRMLFGLPADSTDVPIDPVQRNEYNRLKNEWLSAHCNRKYTDDFYKLFDELSDEAKSARENVDIKLRAIREKYTDKKTGVFDESLLNSMEKYQYRALITEKSLLASKYDINGQLKTGIELQIAEELSKLNDELKNKYKTVINREKFNKIVEQKKKTLSKEEFDKWYTANTKVVYSEKFYEELSKLDKLRYGLDYAIYNKQKLEILAPYRDRKNGDVQVDLMPPQVLAEVARLEHLMSIERKSHKSGKIDTSQLFKITKTKYYDELYDVVNKEAVEYASLNDEFDPLLYEEYMATHFYYKTSYETQYGWQPKSIYTKIIPINPDYIEIVPNELFNELSPESPFYNNEYDHSKSEIYYQPKGKLYDNSKAMSVINKDSDLKAIYDEILAIMGESNEMYGINYLSNYMLPQIDGNIINFIKGKGFIGGLMKSIGKLFKKDEDDEGYQAETITAPDGSELKMIPKYFTKRLKDPSTISIDLASIVMRYYDAAVNFDEKSKIQSKVDILLEVIKKRQYVEKRIYSNVEKTIDGVTSNTYEMANGFADMQLYDSKIKKIYVNLPLFSTKVDISKPVHLLTKAATIVNLGLNLAVAATGGLTSTYLFLVQSLVGRYYDLNDTIHALREFSTSIAWQGIRSIFNRHYKTKMLAMMEESNIGTELKDTYSKLHLPSFVAVALNKLFFYGMSITDFCVKGITLCAILHNFKYVNGKFISKEEYISKGGNKHMWNSYRTVYDCLLFKNGKVSGINDEYEEAWKKAKHQIYDIASVIAHTADGLLTAEQKPIITANVFGGAVMMHRLYLPVVLSNSVLLERQYDPLYHREREAVLRSLNRIGRQAFQDFHNYGLLKGIAETSKYVKSDIVLTSNLKQAMIEATFLIGIFPMILTFMFTGLFNDEDKDKWWYKFMAYVTLRTYFESFAPYNPADLYNTIKTPTAAFGLFDAIREILSNGYDIVYSLFDDTAKFNKLGKSGAYKGKTKTFKILMKSTPFKNIYEQTKDLDSKIRYYEKQIIRRNFDKSKDADAEDIVDQMYFK